MMNNGFLTDERIEKCQVLYEEIFVFNPV